MMERILLGVLCLSGLHISSCLLRQYHYVPEPMTWAEAQAYCRETYTDLATIENIEERSQLIDTFSSNGYNYEVWIGLYSTIYWMYSDEYNDTIRPIDDFCVLLDARGKLWWDHQCSEKTTFICNNGTLQSPEFVHVAIEMNWVSAQKYCRENYIDLASGRNETELQEITSLMTEESLAWTGLFVEPIIDWSDGSGFMYSSWVGRQYEIESTSAACGVAALQGSGRWLLYPCETRFPAACYSAPPTETVFRLAVNLRIEQGESSVDPNDPTVKADILKQLQDRLKESGLSGVTLKWREQPDGKVFKTL